MASGDSAIVRTDSYASQRRKGMKVKMEGSLKLQNGKIVGTSIAHYATTRPDSVLRLRLDGTKMP
jgi:hypothetical protein